MWDAQEKITSRPDIICGMPRTARGASYGGETLCVDRLLERARVQRHLVSLSDDDDVLYCSFRNKT
jgi:hypothetical protein